MLDTEALHRASLPNRGPPVGKGPPLGLASRSTLVFTALVMANVFRATSWGLWGEQGYLGRVPRKYVALVRTLPCPLGLQDGRGWWRYEFVYLLLNPNEIVAWFGLRSA